MAKRLTTAEKGKAVVGNPTAQPRIRICAPNFDPLELIQANRFTLVGRLIYPSEQRMTSVLSYLAKKWGVDPASGSDLGRDCFQFSLSNEEEVKEILHNRPYQFGRWMLIVQRWEPVISPSFPSQIPFWITIKGIPLYYWHEKVVRNIGLELGGLETYVVTRSTACIRIIMDCLKPIPMEPTLEFDSGEKSQITLEYEGLGNHCSYCFRLSHLRSHCPERPEQLARHHMELHMRSSYGGDSAANAHTDLDATEVRPLRQNPPFKQRVDRHGRSFGDRISTAMARPAGPRNKIAPPTSRSQRPHSKENSRSPTYQRDQRETGRHPILMASITTVMMQLALEHMRLLTADHRFNNGELNLLRQ